MKSIAEAQREKLIDIAKCDLMAGGVLPSIGDIQDKLLKLFGDVSFGSPLSKLYHQERGDSIDYEKFFRFLRALAIDTDVIADLANQDMAGLVATLLREDQKRSRISANIDELESRAEDVATIAVGGAKVADSVRTDFERDLSTIENVSAAPNCAALLMAPLKSGRIMTDMLRQATSPSLQLAGPPTASVLESLGLPGAEFQNCLTDIDSRWMHQVVCQGYDGKLEARVSIRISSGQAGPVLNRVDLEVVSGSKGKIAILTDGQPFGLPKELTSVRLICSDQPRPVSNLTLVFSLDGPSYIRGGQSYYVFGLKSLRLLDAAYKKSGAIITDKLSPLCREFISAANIQVEEEVPPGASIDYFVRFHNDYEDTAWSAIDPVNRENPRLPQTASLQAGFEFAGSPVPEGSDLPELYRVQGGMEFWKVGQISEDRYLDRRTAVMYRGVGQWEYERDPFEEERTEEKQYVAVDSNGNALLYTYVEEQAEVLSPSGLHVSKPIQYNASLSKYPSSYDTAGKKLYSVESVIRENAASSSIAYGGSMTNDGIDAIFMPNSTEELAALPPPASGAYVVYLESSTFKGYAEATGLSDQGLSLRALGAPLPSGAIDIVSWRIDARDVVRLMSSTEPQESHHVNFSSEIFETGDIVNVKYRTRIGKRNGSAINPDSFKLYLESGDEISTADYSLDVQTGVVTLSPSDIDGVYCTFKARTHIHDLHRLSGWFKADRDISLTVGEQPTIDQEAGEGVYIDTGEGSRLLSPGAVLNIVPGWQYVSMAARGLATLELLRLLTDDIGVKIFSRGPFFSDHLAMVKPLKQMDVATLVGRSLPGKPEGFAILDDGGVVVPFNSQDNALSTTFYDVYKGEGSIEHTPVNEAFRIVYKYVQVDAIEEDDTITPEVLAGQGYSSPLHGRHVYDRISVKAVLSSVGDQGLRTTPILRKLVINIV